MIFQATDFLAAMFGALRSKIGLQLLKLWFFSRKITHKPLNFKTGWQVVTALAPLLRGRACYSNTYRDNWRHFAVRKLLQGLRQLGCDDTPLVKVKNLAALTDPAPDGKSGLVLLSPHTRVMSAVDIVMKEQQMAVCGIAGYSGDMHNLLNAADAGVVLELGPDTLLEARRHLRSGKMVYACPDFTNRRAGRLYHDINVSPAMFEFSARSNAQLVFAMSRLASNGVIEVTFERPSLRKGVDGAQSNLQAFLDFCREQATIFSDMKVAWPDPQSAKRKQYKNFCTLTRSQRNECTK